MIEKLRQYVKLSCGSDSHVLWQESFSPGGHECEMCGSGFSTSSIGVPSASALYIAPDMIVHYIEAHGYLPPQEFIDALMQASMPDTQDHLTAVLALYDEPRRRQAIQELKEWKEFHESVRLEMARTLEELADRDEKRRRSDDRFCLAFFTALAGAVVYVVYRMVRD